MYPPEYSPQARPRRSLITSLAVVGFVAILLLAGGCKSRQRVQTPEQLAADSTKQARQDSVAAARRQIRKDINASLDSLGKQLSALKDGLGNEEDTDWLADIGTKLFYSAIVLLFTYFLIRFLVWILGSVAEQSATRRLFFKKLIPIVRTIIWSIAVFYLIRIIVGGDGNSLVVAGGSVAVAVGFAAQDTVKNIIGGILIILDQPFQVGDRVRVGGTYGEVVSIGLRSTRIVTPDDSLVTVPNTQVVDGQVANANSGALDCQVVTELFLPGWVDVVRAKEIAYSAAATSRYVYLNKPIVILIKDQFEHAFLTKVVVKAYVLDARYENLFASDVTERAKSEFLKEGLLQPMYLSYLSGGPSSPSEKPEDADV